MTFWDTEAAADPLSDLLSQDNPEILEVLCQESILLQLIVKNELLINYLTKHESIEGLFDWSLSLKYQNHPKYDTISRTATEVMVSDSPLVSVFSQSDVLLQKISVFLSSEDEWDPFCAGHFCRVLLHLTKSTKGEYIKKLPNVFMSMIKNVTLLSVSELITALIKDFYSQIVDLDPIGILFQYLDKNDDVSRAISIILRDIYLSSREQTQIIDEYGKKEVIIKMIHTAKGTNSDLCSIELLRLMMEMMLNNPDPFFCLRDMFNPTEFRPFAAKGYAAHIFAIEPAHAISILCLEEPSHWNIDSRLLHQLKSVPASSFGDAINEANALEKLSKLEKLSPYQIALIGMINDSMAHFEGVDVSLMQTDIFLNALKKVKSFGVPYGGDLPIGFKPNKINAE